MGRERLKRKGIYLYTWMIDDVQEKLMQHCKAIILQFKKYKEVYIYIYLFTYICVCVYICISFPFKKFVNTSSAKKNSKDKFGWMVPNVTLLFQCSA